MTDNKGLIVENTDNVCSITINNPGKRNVLTSEILFGMSDLFHELSTSSQTKCVIIRGAGDKAFSAGYDINELKHNDMLREFEGNHPLEECMNQIENFPYPVIAMLNGHTFGAGLELAVTCDIRICSSDALLGIPPAKLGVVYSYNGTKKFLNLIGTAYTKELFLTGIPVSAERAEKMGLVNFVVKSDEIENFTKDITAGIAENAPLSLKTIKQLINIWQSNQIISYEDEEFIKGLFKKVQDSEDYREGQKAFGEKRRPKFKGK